MLKIAQCTDSFLPVHDGVSRVVDAYARGLSALGNEVFVITPMVTQGYRGRYPFEILDYLAMPVPGGTLTKAAIAPLDVHYLARVSAQTFDIVHAHSPGSSGIEALRLAGKCRAPLIGTFHTKHMREFLMGNEDERQNQLGRAFIFDFFSRCDEIWASSEEAKVFLGENGFSGNVEVFDNGTVQEAASGDVRRRAREEFHLTATPALLFAGSLDRRKNLPLVFEAAALLRRRDVRFQLLIAGSGPDEKHARTVVRELGLTGTVRFLGPVSDETLLGGLYAESALCLCPMQGVSAGLAAREAAVQGTPALAVAGSVSGDLVQNGVNGLTCADTAESMADAIEGFLGDPERIAQMSENARAKAPVSWDAVMQKVNARYQALAGMERTALRRKFGIFRKEMEKVDLTLEKRAMDMIWKFLTQDTQHLYVYGHRPQRPKAHPRPGTQPLMRSTPEREGVSPRAITALLDKIQADEDARVHEIMVLKNGKVIAEGAWAPFELERPHQLYSLSKSVAATAIGMLVDEGRLDLDERLCDIFFDKAPLSEAYPARRMTVRMLLNMSTGSHFNEAGSAMGADWVREFLHAYTKFEPGSAFDYNSMNTYMLSAVVRRKTGDTLTRYLEPRLYRPLGISDYYWETCPNGMEKGGWGLSLTAESVAKIGQLYLNKGVWHTPEGDVRLLSERWIEEATRAQIATPNGEITYGYGHQIWMTAREGAFLFNGAFGQYMLALPDDNALVVLLSGSARLFAQGGVLDYVTTALDGSAKGSIPTDTRGDEALGSTLAALSVRWRAPFFDPAKKSVPLEEFTARLEGRVYAFEKNIGGVFPFLLQSVHNNFTSGVSRLAFSRSADGALALEVVEGNNRHRFTLTETGYTSAVLTQRGDAFEVRFSVQTGIDENGVLSLNIAAHFIETPFARLMRITLTDEDSVRIVFDECPSVQEASEMLMEFTGITRNEIVRNMLPLLKRDRLQHTLRTFTTVTAVGKL